MKKQLGFAAVAIAALALLCQSAEAGSRRHRHHHSGVDPRVQAAGFWTGVGAGVGYFALRGWKTGSGTYNGFTPGHAWAATTIGCAAIAPMVATVWVNRPLTMREGHVLFAGCIVPFLGPMWMNAAYDAHPEWEGKPRRRR